MKKTTIALLSVGLLMTSAAPSYGENQKEVKYTEVVLYKEPSPLAVVLPYFRVDSGFSRFENVKGAEGGNKVKSNNHSVAGAGLGLGVNFGDKVRSDMTWTRHINPIMQATYGSKKAQREPVIDAYTVNLYYELGNVISVFHPYLGIGGGVATVKDNLYFTDLSTNNTTTSNTSIGKKNNFAYKFIAGSTFDLNEKIKFDLSYNYSDYGRSKSYLAANTQQLGKTHYRAHAISAGLRFGM